MEIIKLLKTNDQIISQIEKIENKLYSPQYAQDKADIYDDFDQNGFYGLYLYRQNKIKGYIYG